MTEVDLLVVGGGPAGATVSKYLAASGIDTLLVQRNFSFKKPCGGAIRFEAFERFALPGDAIQKIVNEIIVVHHSQTVSVDISDAPLAIVDRQLFDESLRKDAQENGAIVLEATFVKLEIFDDHIVSYLRRDGKSMMVKSSYLIAADGVNSKIRKLVNGDSVPSLLTRYIDMPSPGIDHCEFHFGSGIAGRYYAWKFPYNDGVDIGTLAGENDKHINRFLSELGMEKYSKIRGYRIPLYQKNIFYKDRVFFVGDSTSQVLPFTYEGIYFAVASAKILSETIIRGRDPLEYEKRWREAYHHYFRVLQKLERIFLYNDLTIKIMMQLFQNRRIQRQIIRFWLGKRELEINLSFVKKLLKVLMFR